MAAPDRNTLRPRSQVSKTVTKRVSLELDTEAIESALGEWLTRHYAEFRNLDLTFDWHCYETIPRVTVVGERTTSDD